MKHRSLAVPIRAHDWSNSSQVVALFTRERGLVEGVAKGAHRDKSPFQGPFDLAVLRDVVWIDRGGGLAIVTESVVVDGYRGIRATWERHLAASYVIEFLRAIATVGEPAADVFEVATLTLEKLAVAEVPAISRTLLSFELRALRVLGFLGEVSECVECGRPWPGEGRGAYFSARQGGLVCRQCRATGRAGKVVALSGRAVRLIQTIANGLGESGDAAHAEIEALGAESAAAFFDRPLRMVKYQPLWSRRARAGGPA